ncbi:CDP-diacylglycerol--glycerol-3-phosphate 3-phosphatidyltransferase [Limibaculum sp. M0105]|uniref:CDP-diacylglycerol--glycerol-3-phosphate 3-phosphatidyltransferase n=1 Tax=Thermohalobaculum xanthum TaxID=2753746 RepID=A0A8J7MAG1_9RHOB|nr:CDP-diacylglycerol--glycerol-3-phosphate 3-phosphatidyltransferase [Thermohalobaculum xanthum]MBK0400770.1 CDP-diacylglycerol--glycerol-3-phosphate 3-phosphatidyltransferase [Thermohalobaculum xanthum]
MRWTVPNLLTVSRVLAAPGVLFAFLLLDSPYADWIALVLFVSAAITDYFDGWLARLWRQESAFGKMLDPIADKLMVAIGLLVLATFSVGATPLYLIPASVILTREILVSGLREFLGEVKLHVTLIAKWKTTAQLVAIGVLLSAVPLAHLTGAEPRPARPSALVEPIGTAIAWGGPTALPVWNWVVISGLSLLWIAAGLTVLSGWDYFRKAMPYIQHREK